LSCAEIELDAIHRACAAVDWLGAASTFMRHLLVLSSAWQN
jgi:hypothetical protein